MDTTAEVQRGAEWGRRSAQVDWIVLEDRVEWRGVTPGVTVLAKGTVGHWCRRTCCPCRQPGLKLGSLVFPVAFLQRQTGVVDVAPPSTQQVRVTTS